MKFNMKRKKLATNKLQKSLLKNIEVLVDMQLWCYWKKKNLFNNYWFMKTINFELSKRLKDLWLLDNIETKYSYWYFNFNWDDIVKIFNNSELIESHFEKYKTLTLEEAIEFIWKKMCQMELLYPNAWMWYLQTVLKWPTFQWDLIEVFEQFIEYLLDNNLI